MTNRSNKAKEFSPNDSMTQHYEVMKEMGDCYAALGDSGHASDCYREAMGLAPRLPGPHIGMGVLAIQDGRQDDAMAAFEKAKSLDPNCAEAYGGMAMVHQHRRQYARAFEMYLTCLELDVDNLTALLGLFQTSIQMGTFGKVIRFLELYLDKHPGDASVLFCLATLYMKEGLLDKAHESLLDVLAIEPGKADAAKLLEDVERRLARVPVQAVGAHR